MSVSSLNVSPSVSLEVNVPLVPFPVPLSLDFPVHDLENKTLGARQTHLLVTENTLDKMLCNNRPVQPPTKYSKARKEKNWKFNF